MINDKISPAGMAALLILSRTFTEVTGLPGDPTAYGMQRFTVIVLSFLLTAAVYLPLAAALKAADCRAPAAVITEKSKLASGFIGVLLTVYLLFCGAETALRAHYYTSSTVFDSAPSSYFFIFTGGAVLFAVRKGLEASARTAWIASAGLAILLIMIIPALFPDMHINRLYPALTDAPETLAADVMREAALNSEYLIFALLCGNIRGRKILTVPIYLAGSCLVMIVMTFLYSTVLGALAGKLVFPFYTLSSLADITLLHRINGIDVMLWSAAGILRLAFLSFAFRAAIRDCFSGGKAADAAGYLFPVSALGLSELFTVFPEIYEPLRRICTAGIPLLTTAVLLPLGALVCSVRERRADRK